jgi:hypothetical protein
MIPDHHGGIATFTPFVKVGTEMPAQEAFFRNDAVMHHSGVHWC